MAARKMKVTVRLERTSGDVRSFWEITRVKTTLSTRFGRWLSAGRSGPAKTFDTVAAAEDAMTKAIEEKRREGYAEPVVRGEAGAASKAGTVARNAELETLIDESPGDASHYLVYADWLQQHVDPRGELIIVQHGIAASDEDRTIFALERDEATLFKKFEADLLGPLARYTLVRNSLQSFRTFSWRYGFIRTARLSKVRYAGGDVGIVLEQLLKHPSGRFLEHLILGDITPEREAVIGRVLHDHAPASLVAVTVEDRWQPTATCSLCSALPRLRHLTLPYVGAGQFAADRLETLRVSWADQAGLLALSRTKLPALKRLHLTVPQDIDESLIGTILTSSVPALQQLSVRRWIPEADLRFGGSSQPVPQDTLARAVALAAAARELSRLDLEMPIGAGGINALSAPASNLRRVGALHVPREGVAPELRARLEVACEVVWTSPPEEEGIELEAIDRGAPLAR